MNTNQLDDPFFVNSTLLLQQVGVYKSHENALPLLHNDLTQICNGTENLRQYINILLTYTPKLPVRQLSIDANIFNDSTELYERAIGLRCLLKNYFILDAIEWEIKDQKIINECMKLIDELYNQSKVNKELLIYNE